MMLIMWNGLIKDVTVEPCFFFYFTAYLILDVVNTNLYLQKSCRFNITSEPDLNTECDDEKQGVLFASKVNSEYRFAMLIICVIYTILSTCWSDEAGRRRRPLIYLPIIGLALQSLSGCLHSYFWQWDPLAAALSELGCEIISGGVVLMITSTQIYMCDVSNMENRTMRLGILLAVRTLCEQLGGGGVGFILRGVGFFYSYLLCFVFSAISLVLALIFVRDVSVPVEKKHNFFQFFNLNRVVDSFRVVFKKSLGRRRIIVALLLAVYIIVFATTQGEKTVFYLFFRYKFHWDERQFSVYTVYKNTGIILGTIFCSVVLSKHFKIHDGVIGMFAGFWDTVAVLGYLFAYRNWHLYVVPLFEVFHGTALSVCVSFFSKYYDNSEFGRLYAVLCVFGLMIPACHPAYNIIFQNTIDFFPAAFFILSASLDVIIIILYCISYLLCQGIEKQKQKQVNAPIEKHDG
ncbi:probable peptidoglycan muropeptide transporter SLC46 [Planococcus citri]|uniref:probable peptidoglycan muropeptide transporter SLC46 n=1 Tax=Planococcus citri TaxID=170843 RepID=UPI0031F83412